MSFAHYLHTYTGSGMAWSDVHNQIFC